MDPNGAGGAGFLMDCQQYCLMTWVLGGGVLLPGIVGS